MMDLLGEAVLSDTVKEAIAFRKRMTQITEVIHNTFFLNTPGVTASLWKRPSPMVVPHLATRQYSYGKYQATSILDFA